MCGEPHDTWWQAEQNNKDEEDTEIDNHVSTKEVIPVVSPFLV